MIKIRHAFLCSTLALCTAVAACGDDDDGGASGVSDGTKLSEVTADQRVALCEEFESKYANLDETLGEGTCTIEGLLAEQQEPGSCEDVKQLCLEDEEEPADSEDEESCADAAEEENYDCPDVTVGEMRACVDAMLAEFNERFGDLTCESDLTGLQPTTPEACQTVFEKCPELQAEVGATAET